MPAGRPPTLDGPRARGVSYDTAFQVRIPAELVDRVNAEAKRREIGRNRIVRRALEAWLAEKEGDDECEF